MPFHPMPEIPVTVILNPYAGQAEFEISVASGNGERVCVFLTTGSRHASRVLMAHLTESRYLRIGTGKAAADM
ncbi:MAG: hypothetical protein R2778_08300 [Saprospiraceae bacterium]